MDMTVKQYECGIVGFIQLDEYPETPREFDNLGIMACWHKRYQLGDVQPKESPSEYMEGSAPIAVKLPLYIMDHSGIMIGTEPFLCQWDSMQVGYIYLTEARAIEEFGTDYDTDKIEEILKQEVRIYSQYLSGDTWHIKVTRQNGKVLNSCGGFFGQEAAMQALNEMAECEIENIRQEIRKMQGEIETGKELTLDEKISMKGVLKNNRSVSFHLNNLNMKSLVGCWNRVFSPSASISKWYKYQNKRRM